MADFGDRISEKISTGTWASGKLRDIRETKTHAAIVDLSKGDIEHHATRVGNKDAAQHISIHFGALKNNEKDLQKIKEDPNTGNSYKKLGEAIYDKLHQETEGNIRPLYEHNRQDFSQRTKANFAKQALDQNIDLSGMNVTPEVTEKITKANQNAQDKLGKKGILKIIQKFTGPFFTRYKQANIEESLKQTNTTNFDIKK